MSGITSHVLDTSRGKPAAGVNVRLEFNSGTIARPDWSNISIGTTNDDGRIPGLVEGVIQLGQYRLHFMIAEYFQDQQVDSFYPLVTVDFIVNDAEQHYHVPLLISPFGYSTYRGS